MDPIFALCGISTKVVVTQHFGEGREVLLTRDLKGIDGVVVVGGDGTFANIAQGLIRRTQADAGLELCENENSAATSTSAEIDADVHTAASATTKTTEPTSSQRKFFNMSSANFVSNSIPIGHIPGGSGNGFAATVAGNADPPTAAILMALGKICYTDVTAVAQLAPSAVMVRAK